MIMLALSNMYKSHKLAKTQMHMLILLDTKNPLDKIQHPFLIKVLERQRIQRTHFNILKMIYNKFTVITNLS